MYIRDIEKEHLLWGQYKKDPGTLPTLVCHYAPFSKMLAKKQFKLYGLLASDFDDYEQNAHIGLIDAISRFSDESGADFHTYATFRIKGEIINGLKSLSEKAQYHNYLKRAQNDRIESVVEGGSGKNIGSVTDISQLIVELAYSHLLEETDIEASIDASKKPSTPYDTYQLQELKRAIKYFVKRLPDREEQIISWHYFEYLSFFEISQLLNISKGRVSQLHHQALGRIRVYNMEESSVSL